MASVRSPAGSSRASAPASALPNADLGDGLSLLSATEKLHPASASALTAHLGRIAALRVPPAMSFERSDGDNARPHAQGLDMTVITVMSKWPSPSPRVVTIVTMMTIVAATLGSPNGGTSIASWISARPLYRT